MNVMRYSWKFVLLTLFVSTAVVYAPIFIGRVPFPAFFIYEFPLFFPSAPHHFDNRVPDIGDLVTQFYPYRMLTARAVRGGEFPMWNPYMTSGTVFLGNPLSALFYPPNALYYVLPVATAWTLGFPLRTFLSGLFTALFLRRIGATSAGAIVAALLFMFSGFMTVWQGQTMPDAALWLPLICYSIVRLHADRSARSVVIVAFAFAMPALAGHPETSAHVTLTGMILAIFLAMFRPSEDMSRRSLRFIGCFAGAGILSLALASVQLFPTLEWFENVYRGLDIIWPPAPTWSILGLVSRDIVGTPNSFGLQIPVQATYVGMLAFVAAPIALLSSPRRFTLFFVLLTVAALCIANGIGPLFEASRHVPLLKTLKNDRMMMLVTFAAAVLAGLGISALEKLTMDMRRQRFRAALLAGIGFYLAAAMIHAVQLLTYASPQRSRSPRMSLYLLVASAVVVAWKLAGGLKERWFKYVICLVLAGDVLTFAYRYIQFEPPSNIFSPNQLLDRLASIERAPFRMTQLGGPFPPNIQLIYGLFESGGYEIPLAKIKKFGEGVDVGGMDTVLFETQRILNSNDRRADLLNTKYYVVPRYDPSYEKFLELPDRFHFRFEYRDITIFENMHAMPAAFLVPSSGAKIVPDDETQLVMLKDPSFDPEKSVLVANTLKTAGEKHRQPAVNSVQWVARRNNSFQLKVDAENDSVLVVSQTYYPGWRAWVDGQEAQIVAADYALTGIAVTAGSHDVRFIYRPKSFLIGLAITAAALLAVGVLLII